MRSARSCNTRTVRVPYFFAAALGVVALAGCSSSSATPSTPASIASAPPTTVLPGTGAARPTTTPPPATTSTASSTSTTSTVLTTTTAAPVSSAPTTVAEPTSAPPVTPASTSAAPAAGFTPVAPPAVPDATAPIEAAWVDPESNVLLAIDDGSYWATVAGQGTDDSGVKFVTYKLTQAFFGQACITQFGDDACDNDLGTLESPSGTMPMFLGASRITVADPSTQQSYEIAGDRLFELLADPTGAPDAPAGYIYAPFAYLLQVQGGQIVSAEQVWTP